ncbi:YafY family protein [Micromonospora sp. CP22]|uniref:helix-turn-helix transcriptional regulator n=1 Tax=Micromonospora sp. CP22 TaxID=2580517 RepID=UPI00132ADC7D|nr:YafY family protein [Micromonospora sp. CP22]MTK00642.1 YafY family transcriptional regulator [Micromonospora sp. CP22]
MRAARLISLLLLLQAREVMTAAELARELEVSERTVYRDVLALSAAGVPVYADRGRAGGYRLLGGYRTRLTGMTRDEAEALFLAGLPGPAGDMGLTDAVAAAQLKVLAALPPSLRDAPVRAGQRFHLDVPGWYHHQNAPPPWLTELAGAVWRDRIVTLRYRRGEHEVTRRVCPCGLVLKSGTWYLVGRVGEDFRTYRVDRVIAVEQHEEGFDREPDFDLAAHWQRQAASFLRKMLRAEVTLRVSPVGLRGLRHVVDAPFGYDEAVAAATGPDEQGWLTLRLPVESVEVAYSQLLGLGPEAEVLDPPELRALLAEAARRTTALYAADRRPPTGEESRSAGDGQR